jgi:dTDP-4-amino-4,6-dideoxygalactose transaminase
MIKPFEQPIYVTRPFLPPLADYCAGLREIWDNAWLTNNGPVLQRYTRRLEGFFGTPNVCLFNNGTLALQIALQGLKIEGEVITTPFTFVATAHALFWNRITPVFVDIEPDTYTLDPAAVEAAITPRTTAILAVHVFGFPCRHAALAAIAERHGLKLIYDAAHAFGVTVDGRPISALGDLSMFSFHATKLYHSIEGGALVFRDAGLKKTFDYLKNFGFENETEVVTPGTNAKMNELQALMGLLVLDRLDDLVARRRPLAARYREQLAGVPGLRLPQPPAGTAWNYAYQPVEILPDYPLSRDALYERLKTFNVFSRRYFYPLLTDFPCYRDLPRRNPLTVATGVASRILTLPIYHGLADQEVDGICEIVRDET